jgi:hypothetical protein
MSLGLVAGRSLDRRHPLDEANDRRNGDGSPATLNRTLARLQRFYSTDSRSVPTTPDYPTGLLFSSTTSPKKKDLSRL